VKKKTCVLVRAAKSEYFERVKERGKGAVFLTVKK